MPTISAACHQVIRFAIARKITSCTLHRPLHRGLRVTHHASHGLLLSPPAKRTDHLLFQADISCATNTPPRSALTNGPFQAINRLSPHIYHVPHQSRPRSLCTIPSHPHCPCRNHLFEKWHVHQGLEGGGEGWTNRILGGQHEIQYLRECSRENRGWQRPQGEHPFGSSQSGDGRSAGNPRSYAQGSRPERGSREARQT